MSMRPLCAASVGLGRSSGFPWRPNRVGIVVPPPLPTEEGRGHGPEGLKPLLSPSLAATAAVVVAVSPSIVPAPPPRPCKPSLSTSVTLPPKLVAGPPPPPIVAVFKACRAKTAPDTDFALSIAGRRVKDCNAKGRENGEVGGGQPKSSDQEPRVPIEKQRVRGMIKRLGTACGRIAMVERASNIFFSESPLLTFTVVSENQTDKTGKTTKKKVL